MTRMTFSPGWAAPRISGRGAFAIGEFGLTSLMDGFIYATSHGRYVTAVTQGPCPSSVWQTFLTIAAIYFVFMMIGVFGYRIPPAGWRPAGWAPPKGSSMITQRNVALKDAHKTKQFWLIWAVLMLNVSAGIGVIGMASPMLQEIFGGSLIGHPNIKFDALSGEQRGMIAAIAAGFTGLLSLFNIGGRFFWASLSDYIGRKNTYYTFFLLGIALYATAPCLPRSAARRCSCSPSG
jgi:hypothetical protein